MNAPPEQEEAAGPDGRLQVALVHADADARAVHAFRRAFEEALGDARNQFVLQPEPVSLLEEAAEAALTGASAIVIFLSRPLMSSDRLSRFVLPVLSRRLAASKQAPLALFTVTLDGSPLWDLRLEELHSVLRPLPAPVRTQDTMEPAEWAETAATVVRALEELQAPTRPPPGKRQAKSQERTEKQSAGVSPPPPPPLPTGEQRLLVAFHAVLSQPSQFTLLESLDPARLADEWQRLVESTGATDTEGVLAALAARHPEQQPHPLWLAWSQVVHAGRLAP